MCVVAAEAYWQRNDCFSKETRVYTVQFELTMHILNKDHNKYLFLGK